MKLELACEVAQPVEVVFNFCTSKAGFLAHFPFKTEWVSGPEQWLQKGERLEFVFRMAGVPIKYRTLITAFERNLRFVDVMEKGPYQFFRHEHLFTAVAGGTRYTDRLDFSGGYWGLGDALVSAPLTRRIFKRRHLLMQQALAAGAEVRT